MKFPQWNRRLIRLGAALALTVPMGLAVAMPARAESNPSCGSVTQIGSTGYIDVGSARFASVKQFKGCGKNWAYVYVWESWRDSHSNWDVCALIRVGIKPPFSREGYKCAHNTRASELWSYGTDTLEACTAAIGNGPDMTEHRPGIGFTDTRC